MPEPTTYRSRVAGKIAIVTGAGAEGDELGIGRAISYVLAREGASVVCADLDGDRAEYTAKQIVSEGGNAISLAADVSKPADCEAIVRKAIDQYGRLDILINNVGVSMPTNLSVEFEQWRRIIDINLSSVMLMSKYAVPEMAKNGGGSIVNISSVAGIRAMGALAYGTSKAGMAQLSREIGVLHGRDGIRVNTVAPGHVMTPHAMKVLPAEMREVRRKVSPLGIEGDAWDVASAVLFLSSDDARFINGVHLAVDGGVTEIGALTGHAFINQP